MAGVSACPDPRQLQQLLLGQISDETAVGLERHVEECDHCGHLLPTLPAEDTLVVADARRGQAPLESFGPGNDPDIDPPAARNARQSPGASAATRPTMFR